MDVALWAAIVAALATLIGYVLTQSWARRPVCQALVRHLL